MAKPRKRPPGRYRAPYRDGGKKLQHRIEREVVPEAVLEERNKAVSASQDRAEELLGSPRAGRSALERGSEVMKLIGRK